MALVHSTCLRAAARVSGQAAAQTGPFALAGVLWPRVLACVVAGALSTAVACVPAHGAAHRAPHGGAPEGAAAPAAGAVFASPASLPPARGYSHAVAVPAGARLVFVSGQVALDSAGALVGAGDARAQTRQVFENLRRAFAAEGATFADVVKLTFYLRDVADLAAVREVRDAYVNRAAPPASTLVEVRQLFRPDVLVEVDAVAAVPPR